MRIYGLALIALAVSASVALAARPAMALRNCGVDRPDVQTLTDPNAGDLDTDQVIGVNMATLAAVPIPTGLAAGTRFNPYETTVWATVGQLTQARLDASGAIEVTLSDPASGDTVTAVLPDAERCAAGADPALMMLMQQARQSFVQAFGTPPLLGSLPLSGEAVVAGVGFMPAGNGAGQGGSGSGIELSPVLGFMVVPSNPAGASPSAEPTATPAPSSTPAPSATPAAGGSS